VSEMLYWLTVIVVGLDQRSFSMLGPVSA